MTCESAPGGDDLQRLRERARTDGYALVQLPAVLAPEAFERLARTLGEPVPELDPAVHSRVDRGVLLHLRTTSGPTQLVQLQPFSSDFLTLHTESSGHAAQAQPSLIVLHCLDEGEQDPPQRTVLVPMDGVARRLPASVLAVLRCTHYENGGRPPPLARTEHGREVFSFRDFHRQVLSWVHDGTGAEGEVNDAIRALLQAMYAGPDACAVRWRRGMLLVIDNRRVFHGRTAGGGVAKARPRHLLRARLRPHDAAQRSAAAAVETVPPLPGLFQLPLRPERTHADAPRARTPVTAGRAVPDPGDHFADASTCELFARAENPDDPDELMSLWLGRVEARQGAAAVRPELAQRWRSSRLHRTVRVDEVLSSNATIGLVKLLFNAYFRDDLYGCLHSQRQVVLSSGAVDEPTLGLPQVLKDTVRYALDRDWYGYSDSRGREATRLAIAELASARLESGSYSAAHVVVTMGATQAIAALADFLLHGRQAGEPVLCGIPNYPPLVASIARRHAVRLVPTPAVDGVTLLDHLGAALRPTTPLVMLQTGSNPGGSLVDERELSAFIDALPASTILILDECHEWLGAGRRHGAARSRANVVRVSSLSKEWSAPGLKVGWFLADPALVSDFYEYASSQYGGPASVMYSLAEVLARLELWCQEGLASAGPAELGQFASDFRLDGKGLAAAYAAYAAERRSRAAALLERRQWCVESLAAGGYAVRPACCSINLLAAAPGVDDSYSAFRSILRETGVSVYPGVLNFYLAGGGFRVTTSRPWPVLDDGIGRLRRWLDRSPGRSADTEPAR